MPKFSLQKDIISVWNYFCNIFAHTSFVQIRWWTPGAPVPILASRGRTTRVPECRCLHPWLRSSSSSSWCRWWPPWTTLFRHCSRFTRSLRLLHHHRPATCVRSFWGVTRPPRRGWIWPRGEVETRGLSPLAAVRRRRAPDHAAGGGSVGSRQRWRLRRGGGEGEKVGRGRVD